MGKWRSTDRLDLRGKALHLVAACTFLGCSITFAPAAHAVGFTVVSNNPGASWSTTLTYVVGGSFDAFTSLEAFIVADAGAGPFGVDPSPPNEAGLGNFDIGSWSPPGGTIVNSNYALASGGAFSSITFDVLFAGDITKSLTLDIFGWTSGVLTGTVEVAAQFKNTGSGLFLVCQEPGEPQSPQCTTSFAADSSTYDRTATVVPEPSIITLLGIGLAGLAGLQRRQRRLNTAA